MGSILCATCSCGYVRDGILAGSGRDPNDEFLPGHCAHCNEVVSVRTNRPRLRCSRCGRKPEVYRLYDPAGLDEQFEDLPHPCPRCRQVALRFDFVGIWD